MDGQVVVITGAGSGIGRAVAVALAGRGATCVLVGRRTAALDETAALMSTQATVVAADLTKTTAADLVVDSTLSAHGRLDVLVHGAGVFVQRNVYETDRGLWDGVIGLNLTAVMELSRQSWPALQESHGQIVLVSSIAATQAFPGDGAYAASKAGLNALGEVMAVEGRDHGIRIITVCPGQVDTPLWDHKAPEAVRQRMMRPAAVGELIVSLVVSDRGIDIAPVFIRPPVDPWQEP